MTVFETTSKRTRARAKGIGDGTGSTRQNASSSAEAVTRLQKLGVGSVTGNRIPTEPPSATSPATQKYFEAPAKPVQTFQAGTFSSRNKISPELLAHQRRSAETKLKHFHTFAGSLIAVLVCSAWLFVYAMY